MQASLSTFLYLLNIKPQLYKHQIKKYILHSVWILVRLWNLSPFVFRYQILLPLTQVSNRLCVCLFLFMYLPRALSIQSAHSPSGAWENW